MSAEEQQYETKVAEEVAEAVEEVAEQVAEYVEEEEQDANPFAARKEVMNPKELRARIEQIKIEKDGHEPHNVQVFTKEEVAKAIYYNSNSLYGSKQPEVLKGSDKGLNGHFTDNLVRAGMYKNHSLCTTMERGSRFIDGADDWTQSL